jgi:hypothetical protein
LPKEYEGGLNIFPILSTGTEICKDVFLEFFYFEGIYKHISVFSVSVLRQKTYFKYCRDQLRTEAITNRSNHLIVIDKKFYFFKENLDEKLT